MSEPCQETAGFLFSHPCPRPASTQCTRCAKSICEQHGHTPGAELLCTTCAREDVGQEEEGDADSGADVAEDPYLYSSYHYNGYGYYGRGPWQGEGGPDPDDFTEADGESLRGEEPLDFEQDMGGS
jgi:hypothetical protein